jgi:hypothetical protein
MEVQDPMTHSTHEPASPRRARGLAETIRALPYTAFTLVILAVAASTVAIAHVPASWLDRSAALARTAQGASPAAAEVLRASAQGDAQASGRTRCGACGVIEAIRRLEPVGDLPAAFELTVRLHDGSTRISSSTSEGRWRSGDHIMLIGGITPSIL